MHAGRHARCRPRIDAGFTRFRPVLMTALAMIIGMLPMSLGLGEGGEQNAPLGRAVIGGLLFATVATLVFVPTVFAAIHGRRTRKVRPARHPDATQLQTEPLERAMDQPVNDSARGRTDTVSRVDGSQTGGGRRSYCCSWPPWCWSGISSRHTAPRHACSEETEAQAVADRGDHQAAAAVGCDRPGAAGQPAGQLRGADLRAHQRLSEALAGGHRHAGEGGPAARRDRVARGGSAAAPGAGRSRDRGGQPEDRRA